MSLGEFLFDILMLWPLMSRRSGPPEFMLRFEVGDRLEQRVNGIPRQQGRVVQVGKVEDGQVAKIEWEDGTQTIGKREDILRSAVRIHPLAPRLDRSGRS